MNDQNDTYFLEVLGNIDDRFIIEIENNWSENRRNILWKKTVLAAVVALFLGCMIVNSKEVVAGFEKLISIINKVFNIKEDISSYSQIIGKTITKNGISVTLDEVILDTDKMIVSYEIISEENIRSEPLLWGEAWINEEKIKAYDSYSEANDFSDEFIRKVIIYRFSDGIVTSKENEIKILLYPEDLDTGYKYGEFKYEFEASSEVLKMDTINIPLSTEIYIEDHSILYLNNLSLNLVSSKITGTCNNLPSVYENYTVVYYVKGKDELGNEVSYRLRNYSNPDVTFEMEMRDSYISPMAKSLSLQLYGKLLSNSSGDIIDFHDDSKDSNLMNSPFDYKLNSFARYTDNPFELFAIGNPIEVQIKDK